MIALKVASEVINKVKIEITMEEEVSNNVLREFLSVLNPEWKNAVEDMTIRNQSNSFYMRHTYNYLKIK